MQYLLQVDPLLPPVAAALRGAGLASVRLPIPHSHLRICDSDGRTAGQPGLLGLPGLPSYRTRQCIPVIAAITTRLIHAV